MLRECISVALTTGEDLFVGAVKGQTEDVGQVLALEFQRLGSSVDGLFHVPQENPPVVSSWRRDRTKGHITAAASHRLTCDAVESPGSSTGLKFTSQIRLTDPDPFSQQNGNI